MTLSLDEVVLAVLDGHDTNAKLRAMFFPKAGRSYVRELDELLAKARKAGRLAFSKGKWVEGGMSTCPTCRGTGKVQKP